MSRLIFIFFMACCVVGCDQNEQSNVDDTAMTPQDTTLIPQDTVYLLNVTDLTNFEGVKSNWSIEDGMLVGAVPADGILEASSWITTKESYGNFEMTMEVKLLGDQNRNSGIYYRGEWSEDAVVGYEYDVGGWGEDNELYWGQLHDPFRRDLWIGPSNSEIMSLYKPEEWNSVRIRVVGDRIQHWLNGEMVVDWTEEDPEIARSGFIAFQMHDETVFQVFYRNIVLVPFN